MRPMALLAALACGAVLALGAHRAISVQPEGRPPAGATAPPVLYAVSFGPGPAWVEGVPVVEQPGIKEHFDYLRAERDAGRLVLAGPWMDAPGGMVVYRAASMEEARRLAEQDPGVPSGVLVVEWVHQWRVGMTGPEVRLPAAEGPGD